MLTCTNLNLKPLNIASSSPLTSLKLTESRVKCSKQMLRDEHNPDDSYIARFNQIINTMAAAYDNYASDHLGYDFYHGNIRYEFPELDHVIARRKEDVENNLELPVIELNQGTLSINHIKITKIKDLALYRLRTESFLKYAAYILEGGSPVQERTPISEASAAQVSIKNDLPLSDRISMQLHALYEILPTINIKLGSGNNFSKFIESQIDNLAHLPENYSENKEKYTIFCSELDSHKQRDSTPFKVSEVEQLKKLASSSVALLRLAYKERQESNP